MRLLILGATGDQGRAQVQAALRAGHAVRAAVRDPRRAAGTLPPQVELVAAPFGERAALLAGLRGVDAVLANFPSSSFNPGGPLIEAAGDLGAAARSAGVGIVVFNTSLPLPPRSLGYAAQDVRLAMRDALLASGAPLVTLSPVVFMDNLLRGWAFPQIAQHDRFVYPHDPQLEVAWLCLDDLAALMLAAAERPELAGTQLAVGGPELLRGADVARTLGAVTGRSIAFVSQPVEEFCAAIRPQLRATEPAERERLLDELARIYRWYNESPLRPFRIDMHGVLAELPVRLTTLRDWAARQSWSMPQGPAEAQAEAEAAAPKI